MASPTRPAAPGKHSATFIFLHGLGDTGDGWCQMLSEICPDHIKVICPNAPITPVTLNMGMRMPSWFDIASLQFDSKEDEPGILQSSDRLKKMIDDEVNAGIPYEKIAIGGFSQGGAVAIHTFITHEQKLAGIVALSTFLTLHKKFAENKKDVNKDTKGFLAHGTSDPVVNLKYGEMTRDVLQSHFTNILWKTYSGMGHSSEPKEIKDAKAFLKDILPK